MKRKIAKYITKHSLLNDRAKVLVALSGGADSVALLAVLRTLNYECYAIHCNFHLRGEESMRDEQFVRTLCNKWGTPLYVIDFSTEEYAKEKRISIEMAARELRYNAFEKERAKIGAEAIAIAHHCDDSAETMLLNLIRGTGIKGLHGIRPKNGFLVRPMLCVDRKDILQYLEQIGEEYVTDSTNLQTDFTRNKIRLQLLPLMREINPSITETLAETAEHISQAELIYEEGIKKGLQRVMSGDRIDIERLKGEPAPQTLLHEILYPLGFTRAQITDIYLSIDRESGKWFESDKWIVAKDRKSFILAVKQLKEEEIVLPAEGKVTIEDGSIRLKTKVFDGTFSKLSNTACLDADTLKLPLTLRRAQKGDRFKPFGMRGSKLVSDYLTDRKRSIIEKERQLVIADANGVIVWLVGERPATPFCITPNTKKLLCIEWQRR